MTEPVTEPVTEPMTEPMTDKTPPVETAAMLGAGVIGASWTALFLAAGVKVRVYDPSPDAASAVAASVANAWPALEALGLTERGDPSAVSFHSDPAAAVDGAGFVQESAPERIEVKRPLFEAIEPALAPGAIVASSASGLTLTEMQAGWRDPARFVLGHPFNPPHLIPLVEVMGNARTSPGVEDQAAALYEALGKTIIRVKREVPGHVANRLQAALWREAIHLVAIGAASVEDVDKAVWAGPGLRWSAMGPHMLFNLAAGPDGLAEFCNRFGPSFHRWWADMGAPRLEPETVKALVDGVAAEAKGQSVDAIAAERDALIIAALKAMRPHRS